MVAIPHYYPDEETTEAVFSKYQVYVILNYGDNWNGDATESSEVCGEEAQCGNYRVKFGMSQMMKRM